MSTETGLPPSAPPPPARRIRGPRAMIDDLNQTVGTVGLYSLFVLIGVATVERFDFAAFGVLGPDIRNTFGLNNAEFVSLASLTAVVPLLLSVHLGYYADRTNRIRLGVLGGIVWGATAIATGLAPVLAVLVIARLVGGVGQLVNQPVHQSLIADYYPPRALAAVFSFYLVGTAAVGLVANPIAGGVSALLGWRATFVILALPTFVLVAMMAKLREPARGESQGVALQDEERSTLGENFRRVRAIKSLRRTWWAATFFGGGVVAFTSILSLYYKDVFHEGPGVRGLIGFINSLGAFIGLIIGGRLSQRAMADDRPDHLPAINGFMVLEFGAGMVLMGIVPGLVPSVIAVFLLGLGLGGYLPAYTTMVAIVSPPRLRGQAISWSLLWVTLGALIVAPIIGGIGDHWSQRVAVAVLGLLVAAAGSVEVSARRFVKRDVAEAVKITEAGDSSAMLVCRGLDVAYEGGVQVLFGVDFEVSEGQVIALLGTNGAGKSTLLRAISGLLDPIGGAIFFNGRDITHADAVVKARFGIVQVPGGRGVFPGLTVAENLRIAGWMFRKDAERLRAATERVLNYFPILREYYDLPAANLSGGQQQMLTLGQALLAEPKLLMIDELSLGLAPVIVEQLLGTVRQLAADGVTIILVEQSVNVALTIADTAYFMEKGEIRFHGPTADLLERPDVLRSVFLEGAGSVDGGRAKAAPTTRPRADVGDVRPVLRTAGVTKRFGGVTAVDDVSIDLYANQILGIIGPNGAGKTTLFDLISGYVIPDGGVIDLHGDEITTATPDVRARAGLGRSFQDARLFPGLTVAETIALALERQVEVRDPIAAALNLPAVLDSETAIRIRVDELIELMGLEAFRDKFISELSTGSRRIVDLACVLAHEPSVILFDEPSSGIAQRETEALGPLLVRIRDATEASLLVIEHDMPLITSISDELVAMDLGRVITRGRPEQVVHDPQVVASYLGESEDVVYRSGTKPAPAAADGRVRRTRQRATARTKPSSNGRKPT